MSEKKKKKSLTSFSILLLIIIALAIITHFVPGVETPATIADVVMAPFNGFQDAIEVCVFVLVLGGFLNVVTKTGALDTGIRVLVKKLKGKEIRIIPILMAVFAICGSTYGMCEETVGFYALISATMVAAGFDTIVGAAVILLGAGIGCLGSTVNPFATGIASATVVSAGTPVSQGDVMLLGIILLVVTYVISVTFVMKYAKKVKNEKGSILSAAETEAMMEHYAKGDTSEDEKLTGKQKAVLVIFALTFVVMILSVIPWVDLFGEEWREAAFGWTTFLTGAPLGDWWFGNLAMWFFLSGIIIGVIGGLDEHELVDTFIAGSADIISVVLIIAVARGASVILFSTGLGQVILESSARALSGVPAFVYAPLSYLLLVVLSFLIPSSSGLASASMGILGPLTAQIGFNPAVMVMIFSAASGLVNLFTPTSGVVMGGLSIAKVEYSTWLKWSRKCILLIALVSVVILSVAMLIM